MTPKKTLKKWFSNFMKPAQEHFAAWIDSYWHKSEQIPMSSIDGLSRAIENTASAGQLLNHLDDTNAHHALFEELKRQIQAIQTILQVDDVNLDTLQEIVTELKANTKLQELIDKKVNKEDGKGLSTNDFTNEHKQKLEELSPLAGLYFSANKINADTRILKPDPYFVEITHKLPVEFIEIGKYLLSYCGDKLGEVVSMKFLGNEEKDIEAQYLFSETETSTHYYLLENEQYNDGTRKYDAHIYALNVTIKGFNMVSKLQLKKFLKYPEWEASTKYAIEIMPESTDIIAGHCNLVPTYGRNRSISVFYQEGVMFSVVKSGYYDEGKITFSGTNGTIEGDTEITGKVGSRAEGICMNGKIYITVHNKV